MESVVSRAVIPGTIAVHSFDNPPKFLWVRFFAFSSWDGVVSSSLHLLGDGDNSRWIDTAIGTLHKAAPVARYPFGFQDSDDTAVEDS